MKPLYPIFHFLFCIFISDPIFIIFPIIGIVILYDLIAD